MTCFSDYAIWAHCEGTSGTREVDHLRRCPWCVRRVQALREDLRILTETLAYTPPPMLTRPRRARVELRWAAVAAAILLLVVASSWRWNGGSGATPGTAEAVAVLSELSARVFEEPAIVPAEAEEDAMTVAFDAAVPCEWQSDGCQDFSQPLF